MKGIYKITNTANGNVYIGQAVNINARVASHINNLKSNNHVNKHLQNAWNKYGQDSFVFSVFVGIFFGLNPASRAAKLDPVVALSGE